MIAFAGVAANPPTRLGAQNVIPGTVLLTFQAFL
jgi:hypothetical protein